MKAKCQNIRISLPFLDFFLQKKCKYFHIWHPETCSWILTLSTLGKNFSRRHFKYFSYFPRKQVLTFHANCLHWRQFAWNVKSFFMRKIRKYHQFVICCFFSPERGKGWICYNAIYLSVFQKYYLFFSAATEIQLTKTKKSKGWKPSKSVNETILTQTGITNRAITQ